MAYDIAYLYLDAGHWNLPRLDRLKLSISKHFQSFVGLFIHWEVKRPSNRDVKCLISRALFASLALIQNGLVKPLSHGIACVQQPHELRIRQRPTAFQH